jgi:hypothetical protein
MPDDASDRDDSARLARRDVLRSLGVAAGVAATGTGAATTATAAPDGSADDVYTVEQGDRCLAVRPLSGDVPAEELYDYRLPEMFGGDNGATGSDLPWYGSIGTTDYQRENTTTTFLYDGPNGLSLVVVHGAVGGTDDGGRGVSWTVTGDVLADGDWVVKDDYYTDPATGDPASTNYDRWATEGTRHRIDWTWGDARTDGGVFRPLGGDFTLTVDPAYNEAATLWDANYYDGRVTGWDVLSFPADGGAPERFSLALDRPVTVRSGPCAVPVDVAVPSRLNPRSRGLVPVTLTGGDDFAPEGVDADALRVGTPETLADGGGAVPAHGGHVEDGALVVHVPTRATGVDPDHTTLRVVGETSDGRKLVGETTVETVPERDDDEDDRPDDESEGESDRDGDDDHEKSDEDDPTDDDHDEANEEQADDGADDERSDGGASDGRGDDGDDGDDEDQTDDDGHASDADAGSGDAGASSDDRPPSDGDSKGRGALSDRPDDGPGEGRGPPSDGPPEGGSPGGGPPDGEAGRSRGRGPKE